MPILREVRMHMTLKELAQAIQNVLLERDHENYIRRSLTVILLGRVQARQ